MGMHTEQLGGRSQQVFFSAAAEANLTAPDAFDVDIEKAAEIDAAELTPSAVNARIRALMGDGYGAITIRNPGAKHSMGVGILNRLNLTFEGSLGYLAAV